jgi:hypothetical protein
MPNHIDYRLAHSFFLKKKFLECALVGFFRITSTVKAALVRKEFSTWLLLICFLESDPNSSSLSKSLCPSTTLILLIELQVP